MYHSWLTFVFLLWANVLWMVPNKRRAMLRSSPFIVIYALFLLLANYIYSLNLNDDELPTAVSTQGINLKQIGFIRNSHYPIRHIMFKSLFTIMFWITMRQMIKENKKQKQKSTLADMVAPLQVTVGAATADLAPQGGADKSSELMKKLGAIFNSVLLKSWLWVVVFVLFTSGMAGQRMTGFRIMYMTLFLVFLIVFQVKKNFYIHIPFFSSITILNFRHHGQCGKNLCMDFG